MTKNQRKPNGQFFTSISAAKYMAELFTPKADTVKFADLGAGTGILTSAVLDHLFTGNMVTGIIVDLFENDEKVRQVLKQNISSWKSIAIEKDIELKVNLYVDNFIDDNKLKWFNGFYNGEYDFIISNPPYKKIPKASEEATIMNDVVHGQPNLYFLFMAMACKLLKDNGEMVFIVPRSWTSGLYFRKFREYLLENMQIELVHQFVSRKKVFENENVLQETIIIKAIKTEQQINEIVISASESIDDFSNPTLLNVPYDLCVQKGENHYVFLPTEKEEIEILKTMQSFGDTLEELGFHMKTGPTVDFRTMDMIYDEPTDNTLPLLWAQNFCDGKIEFPVSSQSGQYISNDKKSLLISKDNYLLIKRFSSKEEKRRLQPAIMLSSDIKEYDYFSAENHLNYVMNTQGGLNLQEVYGLFVIFNSTLWDRYYRILNGSTQVNATECNGFPMPDMNIVIRFGDRLQTMNELSTDICDLIIKEEISGYRRGQKDTVRVGNAEAAAS
jgi:adenine-specific DNA-methyltransferase